MSSPTAAAFPEKLKVLFDQHRFKVLWGGRGAGRCLGKGTKVLMIDGSFRAVEEIQPGDILMGPDSTPRTVLGVTRGFDQLYRVDQAGGGMSYVVNGAHQLSLQKSHDEHWRPSRANGAGQYDGNWTRRYPDEPDVKNISVEDWLEKSDKWKSFFFGYKATCIDFGLPEEKLPIEPYLLGLWLGDGTSRELRVTVHEDDKEIISYCQGVADRWDLELSVCIKPGVKAYDVGLAKAAYRGQGRTNPLWNVFKRLGLQNDKHIPWQYQVASEKDRLALLAGLIDSDGYCNNNGYVFTNTNKELALGAKQLADLLGFKTSVLIKKANGLDRIQDAYNISINGDTWRVPSILPRKIIKQENVKKNKNFMLRAISVSAIGKGEYFGFELDGDHLFVLEDGTVTHNSWGIARALLIMGAQRPIRVLCAREFQKSIDDSVHKVLSDQALALGLGDFYKIEKQGIYGANGTSFAFEGIRNNPQKIKSYEGLDYCWVEEAVKVSRDSWKVLTPTIRKPNSEIWLSFNPELEGDYTYQYFVKSPPPDTVVVHMTYKDNPWFPEVLKADLQHDKATDYDLYLNVWEGQCLQQLEGTVYAKELRKASEGNRITAVPWNREAPVQTAWDLGRKDKTAVWFFQRTGMQTRVLAYYENNMEDILHYAKELQRRPYVYSALWLPHDAFAKRLGMKLTIQEQLATQFPNANVERVPNLSVADGINMARLTFDGLWFDNDECADGLHALRHYRYKVLGYKDDGRTPIFSDKPQHDDQWDASHGADAFRYMAIALQRPGRTDKRGVMERLIGASARNREAALADLGRPSAALGWMK